MNEEKILYLCTPPHLEAGAQEVTTNLLPDKSKDKYEKFYNEFVIFKNENWVGVVTENTLLAFFRELPKKYAPTYLWTKYSFLKSTLKIRDGVDISKFKLLSAFLHKLSKTYKPKKAKTLTEENIKVFLETAPETFFLIKVSYLNSSAITK